MESRLAFKPLVIVVDDDPAVRGALTFSLELDGFEVWAYDSAEALLAGPAPQDQTCLVLDQRLPGVSGLEALEQLRAKHVDAPAILITSNPQKALVEAAAEAGVLIVEKPLLGDTLLRTIRHALSIGPHA